MDWISIAVFLAILVYIIRRSSINHNLPPKPRITAHVPQHLKKVVAQPLIVAPTTVPPPAPLNKPRILIVEDSHDVQDFMREILEAEFAITIVEDGKDALTKLKESRYDLILTAIGIPGLDGFEFLKHKKALGSKTPVVVVTGMSDGAVVPWINDMKADFRPVAFVSKPFSQKVLLESIKKHLPQSTADLLDAVTASMRPSIKKPPTNLKPREILLLAEDPQLCKLVINCLPNQAVKVAKSPIDAARMLSQERFALVIVTNFGIRPWDAIAVIPKEHDYPVFFLTGHMDDALEQDCQTKGIKWRTVPIKIISLRQELRLALDELEL